MTSLPVIGATKGSQAANQSVAATATASGTITFPGLSGIQGSTITAVVTVPNAPPTSLFTATLGTPGGQGVIVDTWGGDSTAGPFQVLVGQTLVVTGIGLTLSTPFTCTYGTVTDVGAVQTVIPAPNSSALNATITALGVGSLLSQSLNQVPSAGSITITGIPVGSNIRTLVLLIVASGGSTVTNVSVAGGVSGNPYYNQPPYLPIQGGLPKYYTVVIPFISVVDSTVNLVITTAATCNVSVYGDTAQYNQSLFYNGYALGATASVTATGSSTIVSGPCRLLSVAIDNTVPGTTGAIQLGGTTIIRCDNVAAATQATNETLTMPDNTIIPLGTNLTVTCIAAGPCNVVGSAVYAIP